ncbi:ATP-binding protein [Candidatus Saccharibacteria bacterium]|nr:ATP-binding protein [Candidatus Saccharibacteria bacterium]
MNKGAVLNPLVIVVVGLPGSGKSFFATQFAASLGAALVSEDKIRWVLFAHHTYSDDETVVVKQVANMLTEELFKTKKTFVLDGGYNDRATRTVLGTQAKKAGYDVLTIVVQTDIPTAKQRSFKRNAKRAGDIYKQSLDANSFETQSKKYHTPLRTDKTVVISGKHTYSTQANVVMKKILEAQGVIATDQQQSTPTVRLHGPFIR